jgi:hypothetical protein
MLKTLAPAAVLAAFALPAPVQAVERPPMKSCGDLEAANGLLVGDFGS